MQFYQNYVRLCNQAGKKPTAVADEVGISRATASRWGRGMVPSYPSLMRIADYFDITVGELVGATPDTASEIASILGVSADLLARKDSTKIGREPDLEECLEDLRSRPETRALLAATRGMTKEQVELMANFAKSIRGDGN